MFLFLEVMSAPSSSQALLSPTSVFCVHRAQYQLSRALQTRSHSQAHTNLPSLGWCFSKTYLLLILRALPQVCWSLGRNRTDLAIASKMWTEVFIFQCIWSFFFGKAVTRGSILSSFIESHGSLASPHLALFCLPRLQKSNLELFLQFFLYPSPGGLLNRNSSSSQANLQTCHSLPVVLFSSELLETCIVGIKVSMYLCVKDVFMFSLLRLNTVHLFPKLNERSKTVQMWLFNSWTLRHKHWQGLDPKMSVLWKEFSAGKSSFSDLSCPPDGNAKMSA